MAGGGGGRGGGALVQSAFFHKMLTFDVKFGNWQQEGLAQIFLVNGAQQGIPSPRWSMLAVDIIDADIYGGADAGRSERSRSEGNCSDGNPYHWQGVGGKDLTPRPKNGENTPGACCCCCRENPCPQSPMLPKPWSKNPMKRGNSHLHCLVATIRAIGVPRVCPLDNLATSRSNLIELAAGGHCWGYDNKQDPKLAARGPGKDGWSHGDAAPCDLWSFPPQCGVGCPTTWLGWGADPGARSTRQRLWHA